MILACAVRMVLWVLARQVARGGGGVGQRHGWTCRRQTCCRKHESLLFRAGGSLPSPVCMMSVTAGDVCLYCRLGQSPTLGWSHTVWSNVSVCLLRLCLQVPFSQSLGWGSPIHRAVPHSLVSAVNPSLFLLCFCR
jgi:hypothetical protein